MNILKNITWYSWYNNVLLFLIIFLLLLCIKWKYGTNIKYRFNLIKEFCKYF